MQRIPAKIVPAQLGTSAAANYTVGTNKQATISALTLCNTTAGAVTATVYLVPNAGTAGDSNTVLHQRSLAANETYVVSGAIAQTLNGGDTIQALASAASSITLIGSVYETTT